MAGKSRTRSSLVMDIMKLVLGKYPITWKAKELAVATAAGQRTVERVLADMTEKGLLEKRYHDYTLSTKLVTQLYGAKWYLQQQIDKDILLTQRKEKRNEKGS